MDALVAGERSELGHLADNGLERRALVAQKGDDPRHRVGHAGVTGRVIALHPL